MYDDPLTMKSLLTLLIAAYCCLSTPTYAQFLGARLPDSIVFTTVDGGLHASYEIQLTNFHHDTVTLEQLEVLDKKDSNLLKRLDGATLQNSHTKIGSKTGEGTLVLPSGSSSIIYIELPIGRLTPAEIVHKITFDIPGQSNLTLETVTSHCITKNQLVLGKPLAGGNWAAIYEPSWVRGHRRVIYLDNGIPRIPGRYAIDFIQVDDEGNFATGDKDVKSNWLGYGADVLAVADGIVSTVRDDFPETPTLSDHPAYGSKEATGNYISICIGENQYAFYEHLKSNSITVKPGQQVKKGDVIAALGLTGQGTSPHLHFHMADTDSPLGAESIPFAFERFNLLGHYPDFKVFGRAPWQPHPDLNDSVRFNERPVPNAVLIF